MRQKIISSFLLLLSTILFFNMVASRGSAFIPRIKAPQVGESGWKYYYSSDFNPFYPQLAPYYKRPDGYVTGNCTWYAWGRACELAGEKLEPAFMESAGEWWGLNKRKGWYPYGNTPKEGAIICYKTHVGIVEKTDPLTISESGWKVEKENDSIVFHYGKPWREKEKILGYIYILQ